MTKEQYLMQVANLKSLIAKKQERLEEYHSLASSPATAGYGERVSGGTHSNEAPFVKWVYKIIEVENEIKELQERVDNLQATIIEAIEALDNEDYKTLLVHRYLQALSWEKVAEKMFISRWTASRWHKAAIEQLKLPV